MGQVIIEDVRICKQVDRIELVVDFDNDRHHMMPLQKGDSRDILVGRLYDFIKRIAIDKLLDDN